MYFYEDILKAYVYWLNENQEKPVRDCLYLAWSNIGLWISCGRLKRNVRGEYRLSDFPIQLVREIQPILEKKGSNNDKV